MAHPLSTKGEVTSPTPPSDGVDNLTHAFLGWALLAVTMTTSSQVCPTDGTILAPKVWRGGAF